MRLSDARWCFNQLLAGGLTTGQATELFGPSMRQVQRLRAAYREDGPHGVAHRLKTVHEMGHWCTPIPGGSLMDMLE